MPILSDIRVPPAPLFPMNKKVVGPEELQRVVSYARELQQAVLALQTVVVNLQGRVDALEAA